MSGMFTVGADPEVFVRKNGKPISAYGLIPGTKESPHKTERGAYQVDGMALEFNIDPTDYNDFPAFNHNIVKTIADMRVAAGNVNLNISPVQEFPQEYMDAQPDAAKELGCDPDYDAYEMKANPRPPGDRLFRTGAGHIHVGWGADIPIDNDEHMEICAGFVKTMDATVGMFMTVIDRDPRRRELYGKAGAFRPKSYGVEYRTPSNVWIKNKSRRKMVHLLIKMAIDNQCSARTVEGLTGHSSEQIRTIINTGDVDTAKTIMNHLTRFSYTGALWTGLLAEADKEFGTNVEN